MTLDLGALLPALLPRAIAWGRAQEQQALSKGAKLVAPGIDLARAVGVAHPDRVRVSVVPALPLPAEPDLRQAALQAGLLGPGMVGLTLGYAVFLCAGREREARLLRHEFRHVYQYEQAGSIDAFLPIYLSQIVRFGYHDCPFEIDARAHEDERR